MAREADRDPADLEISVFGSVAKAPVWERDRGAGVSRVVLALPSAARDEICPMLDAGAHTMETVG